MTRAYKQIFMLALACWAAGLWISPQAARAGAALSASQGSFAPVAEAAAPAAPAAPPPVSPAVAPPDPNATPQAAHYESTKIYTGERISLDFQNADLHNIIRIIGEVSGKNIVVSDAVNGKVTLKLKDVPWDQALDIVLSSRNLGVEESGNVLTIYDLPTLSSIQAGRERVAAERAAAQAQMPLAKKVFTPKYAPISTVASELTKIKTARGKIVAIGNDIYVEDEPGSIASMSQIFLRIDRVARQILIEARIIDATATFTNRLGVDWHVNYDKARTGSGVTPGDGVGSIDMTHGAAALGFGFLNKAGSLYLNAAITASETSNDARTVSAPRIMAANDQKVSIKQGTQIPYSTSSANNGTNVQFKEAEMELEVTPHIEENGQIVTLDIKLTNDSQGELSESGPAINTNEAETKLMVKDGETVVIGGIIKDQQITGTSRVPGLHRIPILGWLFQERNIDSNKREILIFITANIIPINI
ncbi:MAG: type IV pilus secretin PilQ [Candidatus Adiutrix sp.]|jgi:type IV pilus assembly protein PilQ|nr:type IV pilus secretin PilQ [Candidatus Adiutrix sp.]